MTRQCDEGGDTMKSMNPEPVVHENEADLNFVDLNGGLMSVWELTPGEPARGERIWTGHRDHPRTRNHSPKNAWQRARWRQWLNK